MTDRSTVDRRKSSPQHRAEYAAAKAAPTEHQPRLVTTRQVRNVIHGAGSIGQFNSRLAVLITKSVGTMWAAYLFVLIAFVSLPQAWHAFMHGDTVTGISWLSQSFLQLVLLAVIIVGQDVQAKASDARAAKTFEDIEIVTDRVDTTTQGGLTDILAAVQALDARVGRMASGESRERFHGGQGM